MTHADRIRACEADLDALAAAHERSTRAERAWSHAVQHGHDASRRRALAAYRAARRIARPIERRIYGYALSARGVR